LAGVPCALTDSLPPEPICVGWSASESGHRGRNHPVGADGCIAYAASASGLMDIVLSPATATPGRLLCHTAGNHHPAGTESLGQGVLGAAPWLDSHRRPLS